jgi:hypothetical protein
MTFDLSQLNTYYIIALPAIVAFLAGLIRQDKLPQWLNEALSLVLVLILAAVQALLGGKLGGGTLTDFAIITSYAAALVHTPPLAALQQYLQSNLLSFGKPATSSQPGQSVVQIDTPALAGAILQNINLAQLAVLLKAELMKTANTSPAPARPLVSNLPTQPTLEAVRTNTPPPNKAG